MEISMKLVMTGLVALGATVVGCAPKKSFNGAANSTTAPKAAEQVPEVDDPVEEEDPIEEETVEEETVEVETGNVFKDCDASSKAPFQGDLYKLPAETKRLPDYSELKPIKKICLNQIDIKTREFTDGFPGVDGLKEWFSINFDFVLEIETEGEYEFIINSDDGSKLFIDGNLVIDHDGQHSPEEKRSKKVLLKAGSHKVNLPYFQGPANQIALELFWIPPGGSREYIPTKFVSRPE